MYNSRDRLQPANRRRPILSHFGVGVSISNAPHNGAKAPADTTVVVAMSGGVDSSVAAALLVERGYRCIGVMMRLWTELRAGEASTNKCCSLESVADARRVADQLGIPFYLINVEQPFKQQVVDRFIVSYSAA